MALPRVTIYTDGASSGKSDAPGGWACILVYGEVEHAITGNDPKTSNNRMEMMVTPPDAVDPKPPVGMSPQAATNTQERYDKSFKEKEEPPTIRWLFK